MAQEEHALGCSYSGGGSGGGGGGSGGGGGGGGCSGVGRSKKVKQKKVPQRGLGVAQLEKIRLEEQQRKESIQAANIFARNAIGSPCDSTAQFLAVQCPKFGPNLSPFQHSVPLPPPPPPPSPPPALTNLPSSDGLYRNAPSVEIRHEGSVQISNAGGGEIGSKAISGHGNRNWPRLWNGEHNFGGDKQRLDRHGFAFEPQVNLPYESNPNPSVLPHAALSQRSHQYHWPSSSSSSSMASSYSGISPSSVVNSQMEPPSNQSFHGNNYTPSWPEEEKMVGVKRSYPFSLETPPAPSLHGGFHSGDAASMSKSDELASSSNGCTAYMEPRNKFIREGPSNSSPLPEPNPNEATREHVRLNGDFLTLAPPAIASPPLDLKLKHTIDYSGHQGHKLSEYERMAGQEHTKSQTHQAGPSASVEQQTFSFFPIKLQANETTTCVSHGNGEKEETIDLDLKL